MSAQEPTEGQETAQEGEASNPYPQGSGEWLLYEIFGALPGPDACECGMPTQCPPPPSAVDSKGENKP